MRRHSSAAPWHPRVFVLVVPGVQLLDLAGPAQVFDAARAFGVPYELHFVSSTAEQRSAQGLAFTRLEPLGPVRPGDLVLVPGAYAGRRYPTYRLLDDPTSDWLHAAVQQGVHIASICTGALALAQTGLLDGHTCTTHWALTEELARRHPNIRVQDGALYVTSGNLTTSAGVASGVDMALALLERAHGPLLAAQIARYLLVYHRRSGSAPQESVFITYRNHLHPAVHRVQDRLAQHYARPTTLEELARLANMSTWGLHKAFKQATGLTPLQYQQQLRLEAARALLADDTRSVEDVASLVGFQNARHLRRLFQQKFGHSPRDAKLTRPAPRISPRAAASSRTA